MRRQVMSVSYSQMRIKIRYIAHITDVCVIVVNLHSFLCEAFFWKLRQYLIHRKTFLSRFDPSRFIGRKC